jgi:hypothetical protein
MRNLTIASLNIGLSTIDKNFMDNRLNEYENTTFTKGDMILKAVGLDELKKPEGDSIKKISSAAIVKVDDNRLCRYITNGATDEILQATYYTKDYSEVEIQLLNSRTYMGLSLADYEYIMTGSAFSDRLTELGGLVLHGSSIAYENQGIIFSANSGTGKSTHTGLWKQRFGKEVTIINDDKPALRFYDNIPFIFGTPWSGKTYLNTNIKVPLKAIVFIKRAESNWIERLNVRDSIFNLASQTVRPYYDEDLGKKALEFIERLLINVPIYRLHCNISQEAVETAYKQIINKEIK